MRPFSTCAVVCAMAFAAGSARADILQISESAFQASAGLITFSEYPVNTMNPVYGPAKYGGGASSPTVTFGGYFKGQAIGTPATCPAGAAITGCVVGSPTGPLALDPKSPATFITTDVSTPTSPVLSGSPLYNGPVAIEFSTPQVGVGLTGGYFNAVGSTAITAFDAHGNVIGAVKNSETGIEFLGLVTADGSADISGLLFSLVGDEPAGFVVDNIRFGEQGQVTVPGQPTVTPEPSTLLLLGTGLLGTAFMVRRTV